MSSFDKGKRFEERFYELLKEAVRTGAFGLDPSVCQVFLRKPYPSRSIPRDIIIDVSIELHPNGQKEWALLWAWECKDYNSTVPVGDLEEFHAKLQQISGTGIKGGIAATGTLQKSAINYAIGNKMSIVRIMPDGKMAVSLSGHFYIPVSIICALMVYISDFHKYLVGKGCSAITAWLIIFGVVYAVIVFIGRFFTPNQPSKEEVMEECMRALRDEGYKADPNSVYGLTDGAAFKSVRALLENGLEEWSRYKYQH
jgi:hypothetical protein